MPGEAFSFRSLEINTSPDGTTNVSADFSLGPVKINTYMSSLSSAADFSYLNDHENMTMDEKEYAFILMFRKLQRNARGLE
jgi:hypothetical protein